MVKLREIILPHQPYKADFRVSVVERSERINSVARAESLLDNRRPNARSAGLMLRRGIARREWRHVARTLLQWIARRDKPPDLIQPQRLHREQANSAVAAMGRVKRSAEKADFGQLAAGITAEIAKENTEEIMAAPAQCRAPATYTS